MENPIRLESGINVARVSQINFQKTIDSSLKFSTHLLTIHTDQTTLKHHNDDRTKGIQESNHTEQKILQMSPQASPLSLQTTKVNMPMIHTYKYIIYIIHIYRTNM